MMKQNHQTTRYWIIGASEGIGLEMVKQLLSQGAKVVASSRNARRHVELDRLYKRYPLQLTKLSMDVTEFDRVEEKLKQAWQAYQGIDVWIYNAGVYQPRAVTEASFDDYLKMNQVNYLGATAILSAMFNQKMVPKTWLWNISLASDFGLPYGGAYSAPKAALQNLAESLAPELKQFGVDLKVINHGFVKTRLTDKNDFDMIGLITPEKAAEKILSSLKQKRFETRFPWSLSTILRLLKISPKTISLAITNKMLKQESKS